MTDAWVVLRTSSRATLRLAASLTSDGIEAWSPKLVIDRRRPRGRGRVKSAVPLTPSFVFARAGHLDELHERSERPGSEFSIFHHYGTLPLIADSALEPLRSAELGCAAKAMRYGFAPGQSVRVAEGIAAGMEGIVGKSNWRITEVGFKDGKPMKFATSILREIVRQEPTRCFGSPKARILVGA